MVVFQGLQDILGRSVELLVALRLLEGDDIEPVPVPWLVLDELTMLMLEIALT